MIILLKAIKNMSAVDMMLSQSLHFLLCTTLCLVSTCTKLWLCPSYIFKEIANNKTTGKSTKTRTATTNSQPESTLCPVLSIQWSSELIVSEQAWDKNIVQRLIRACVSNYQNFKEIATTLWQNVEQSMIRKKEIFRVTVSTQSTGLKVLWNEFRYKPLFTTRKKIVDHLSQFQLWEIPKWSDTSDRIWQNRQQIFLCYSNLTKVLHNLSVSRLNQLTSK